jgi:hypothetical protein
MQVRRLAVVCYHGQALYILYDKSKARRSALKKIGFSIVALIIMLAFTPQPGFAQTGKTTPVNKIPGLIEKSGFPYTKVKEGVWQIDFQGKNLKSFQLRITLISDQLILFVDLANRSELNLNNGLAVKLLELNDAMDTIKFALSEKSLYARMEAHERIIDLQELKYMLNQISAAIDEAYPQIKEYLN